MSAKSKIELFVVLLAMIFNLMFLYRFDSIESEIVLMLNALSFLCGAKLTYEVFNQSIK